MSLPQSTQQASRCIGQPRRPPYSVALTLALLALGGCFLLPSEPDQREFSFDIQGTVRSGLGGEPIDQARVVLYKTVFTGSGSKSGGTVREVIQTEFSTADGRYWIQASFRDTRCGLVTVGARSSGHANGDISLNFAGGTEACHGTPVVIDFMLTPDEGSE